MPFNGTGVFQRIYSWVTDAANNINVDATRTDTDTDDIADGLSNCITKDGQQNLIANIPWGGYKITGLGNGSLPQDAVTFSQTFTSPAFTGVPTAPTAAPGTSTTQIATTSFVATSFAPLASPALTGTPTAPTAIPGTSTTQIATTSYVATSYAPLASPALTGTPTAPTAAVGTNTTQIATMAALIAQAFSTSLPAQPGGTITYKLQSLASAASWAVDLPPTGSAIYMNNNFGGF